MEHDTTYGVENSTTHSERVKKMSSVIRILFERELDQIVDTSAIMLETVISDLYDEGLLDDEIISEFRQASVGT